MMKESEYMAEIRHSTPIQISAAAIMPTIMAVSPGKALIIIC
jgi:hypothetical protein